MAWSQHLPHRPSGARPRNQFDETSPHQTGLDRPALPQMALPANPYIAPPKIKIDYTTNDIWKAPSGSVLVHACNCLGFWGSGIALAFQKKYPYAFTEYQNHCKKHNKKPADLLGTCLLIEPPVGRTRSGTTEGHLIGCLFTRENGGSPGMTQAEKDDVVKYTEQAFGHLLQLLKKRKQLNTTPPAGEIHMPKINSGLFTVDWNRTKDALLKSPPTAEVDKVFVHMPVQDGATNATNSTGASQAGALQDGRAATGAAKTRAAEARAAEAQAVTTGTAATGPRVPDLRLNVVHYSQDPEKRAATAMLETDPAAFQAVDEFMDSIIAWKKRRFE